MKFTFAIAAIMLLAFVSFASSSSPPTGTVVALTKKATLPTAAAVPGALASVPLVSEPASASRPVLESDVPFQPESMRHVALLTTSERVGSDAEGEPAVGVIEASVVREDALAATYDGIHRITQGGRITPASNGAA